MLKIFRYGFCSLLIAGFFLTTAGQLQASPKKNSAYSGHSLGKKAYSKKAPYAGFGKKSSVNGQYKMKIVKGHMKKASKGYTYVNPYARSK